MSVENLAVHLRIEEDNKMAQKNTYTPDSAKASFKNHRTSNLEGLNSSLEFIQSQEDLETKKVDARLECFSMVEHQTNFDGAHGGCKFKILELNSLIEKKRDIFKTLENIDYAFKSQTHEARIAKKVEASQKRIRKVFQKEDALRRKVEHLSRKEAVVKIHKDFSQDYQDYSDDLDEPQKVVRWKTQVEHYAMLAKSTTKETPIRGELHINEEMETHDRATLKCAKLSKPAFRFEWSNDIKRSVVAT
ncbi:hypothetical protein Tco_1029159 [Tanacetum coccineum]|uniref:Uncharacterized protein n=1 Tax=Tanacetum coccineum TaxID=301880 RepID=A0ABQ5G3W3_9ASTR